MKRIKLLDLLVSFMVLYFASMCIHEYGHYLMLVGLGGAGYIKGFSCYATVLPPFFVGSVMFYLAGGLIVVTLYLLWHRIEEDPEDKIILVSVALLHLVYGIVFEPLRFITKTRVTGEIGSLIGHLVMISYFLAMMYQNRESLA